MLLGAVFTLVTTSCDRATPTIARWERRGPTAGLGTSNALNVVHSATITASGIASEFHSACIRPGVDPEATGRWTTTIVWTRKARAVPSERIATTETWAHDGPTPVMWERRLTARVPDGRFAVRSASLVDLGDLCAAGLDDRLVVAPDRDDCVLRLEQSRTAAVDELLALTGDMRFADCAPLTVPLDARVRWALEASDGMSFDSGRTGWVQWSDRSGGQVVVRFDEAWSEQAIVLPEEPPTSVLDSAVDWRAIEQFVENGRESGWLREARAVDAQAP